MGSRGLKPKTKLRKAKRGVCGVCGCPVAHPAGHVWAEGVDQGRLIAVRCLRHVEGLGGPDYSGSAPYWSHVWGGRQRALEVLFNGVAGPEPDRGHERFVVDGCLLD